jgi:hypothetical protein
VEQGGDEGTVVKARVGGHGSCRRSGATIAIALALVVGFALAPATASAAPVRLDFDTLPSPAWLANDCETGTATVSGGILTLDSPSCFEYILNDTNAPWYQTVSNARGWAIETRLRVGDVPGAGASCESDDNGVLIWAHDRSMLIKVSVASGGVCLLYPEQVAYAMDTTDVFHTYRVETKGRRVKVFVDGVLRIDHTLTVLGNGTEVLYFGDGSGGSPSRSFWDYFEYDTFADNVCLGQAPTILGTPGDDTLTGTAGPDIINGLGGNDSISGLGGDDLLCGGAGNDTLAGGDGGDRLQGAAGDDSLSAGAGDDVVLGGPGNDQLFGGAGRDKASFYGAVRAVAVSLTSGSASGAGSDTMSGVEDLTGSAFADTLTGDAGPNVLRGRQGDDTLDGAAGTDTLFGDAGSDTCLNGEVLSSC